MKKLLFLCLLMMYCNSELWSQLNHNWSFAVSASGIDYISDHAVDTNGDVIVIGSFSATFDIDPSPSSSFLSVIGEYDLFVAKFSSSGSLLWAKSIGGNSSRILGWSLQLDNSGNIFIAGGFLGTIDFDPGPTTTSLTSSNNFDSFVSKYDQNGNHLWVKSFSGGKSVAYKIFVNTSGIWIGGNIDDESYFGKLSLNGNLNWMKILPSSWSVCKALWVDGSGNVIVGGFFYGGNIDMDPGPGYSTLLSNSETGYLGKYDQGGGLLWSRSIGYPSARVYDITANSTNIFLTGRDGSGIHISSWNMAGNAQWINTLYYTSGNSGVGNEGSDIAIASNGNILVGGTIHNGQSDAIDFDPSSSVVTTAPANAGWVSFDCFVAEYDPTDGSLFQVDAIGGGVSYSGLLGTPGPTFKFEDDGSIYISGTFNSDMYMNPGGTPVLSPATTSVNDSFLGKYNGLEKNDLESTFTIYPNPVTNKLFILSNEPVLNVLVYDSQGRSLIITNEKMIDVSELPNGIFWIHILSSNGVQFKKFVKL